MEQILQGMNPFYQTSIYKNHLGKNQYITSIIQYIHYVVGCLHKLIRVTHNNYQTFLDVYKRAKSVGGLNSQNSKREVGVKSPGTGVGNSAEHRERRVST